jgi:enoyl-CoA hydratase
MATISVSELVIVERPAPALAVVRLNRPDVANALSSALRRALVQVFEALADNQETRVVILTGNGRAFCAGLDLRELGESKDALSLGDDLDPVASVRAFPGIVIGAINGAAVTGGLELALACDFLIAGRSARFADTHAKVGALPGWQLSQRLSRTIGIQRAKRMAFTGMSIDATEAAAWGLVSECVDDDRLEAHALQLAQATAQADRSTLARYKRLIDDGYALSLGDSIDLERVVSSGHNGTLNDAALRGRADTVLAARSARDDKIQDWQAYD